MIAEEPKPRLDDRGRRLCDHANAHGIYCGLPYNHAGEHELDEQLVEPDPFCLHATDPFTLALIRGWIIAAHGHKVNPDKIQRAEEHYKAVARWQRSHGTHLPD